MKLAALVTILDVIAPPRDAEPWDNVGLLVGDPDQAVSKIFLTIDYTVEVAAEAQAAQADAIIAYHPPIFHGLKQVTSASTPLIFDAIRRGVAIYSPHTALDIAADGTNDMLADALGLTDRAPLRTAPSKSTHHKLVTFVPEKDVERVSQALFAAGAGRIGQYSSCSFRSQGTGTFFGEEGTTPSVGRSGQLERAPEIRLETVLPLARIEAVLKALHESHPYEEPAFDLVQLAVPPNNSGMGRIGKFPVPISRRDLIDRVKRELSLPHLLVAGPLDGVAARAAVRAGSCGNLLDSAIAQKADLYLTGEMRHHDALKAAAAGLTVLCTLHSNSERAVLRRLQSRLHEKLSGLPVQISKTDRDPFVIF